MHNWILSPTGRPSRTISSTPSAWCQATCLPRTSLARPCSPRSPILLSSMITTNWHNHRQHKWTDLPPLVPQPNFCTPNLQISSWKVSNAICLCFRLSKMRNSMIRGIVHSKIKCTAKVYTKSLTPLTLLWLPTNKVSSTSCKISRMPYSNPRYLLPKGRKLFANTNSLATHKLLTLLYASIIAAPQHLPLLLTTSWPFLRRPPLAKAMSKDWLWISFCTGVIKPDSVNSFWPTTLLYPTMRRWSTWSAL